MANRTPRMEQIEVLLAQDPGDPFLRYGLAMEYASAGDDATAAQKLLALTADSPDYVPAYLQAGQILARLGRDVEACEVLRRGIAAARRTGDSHAEGEMQGFLASLEYEEGAADLRYADSVTRIGADQKEEPKRNEDRIGKRKIAPFGAASRL